ncbi:exosome complex component MTR3-like [Limulus polyphemus]|uniref:Exosome complex component MTR3-like n=1 Tax=Limulus polyphemus TaxID=6850 RepID=A0ABM1BSM3_LIMPO|nr:exosome complex component MTR3-like [Limulus polyphemus]
MPLDGKRICGPEGTKSPLLFIPKKQTNLLDDNRKRTDGRHAEDLRPLFLRLGINSQARGSAYIEMNRTKVVATVYGPREIQRRREFDMKGQLLCEFKFAPFSCKVRRQYQPDNEEKALSSVLRETLEPVVCLHKFPKSRVDIFVLVLENDGSALAAAITCAGAALVDAGIDMYDVVIGCGLRQDEATTLVDPVYEEEYRPEDNHQSGEHGNMVLGFMPLLQQVAALQCDGELQPKTVSAALGMLMESCYGIYSIVQECLTESLKNKLKKREKDVTKVIS